VLLLKSAPNGGFDCHQHFRARPLIVAVDMADRSQVEKTSPQLVVESHELKLPS